MLTSRGKPWTNLQLRRVLMNATYAGLLTYDGKVVEGVVGEWKALWDINVFYALCAFLKDESRRPGASFERKHVGSGVYRCGKCGAPLYAARPSGQRNISYICRAKAHLGRSAAPLDAYVELLVLKLLRRSDIHRRLTTAPDVDLDALQAQRAGLTAQKDKLANLLVEGVLTETGVRRESKRLAEQIDAVTATLTAATRTSPAARMLADGVDKVQQHWDAATPDIRGKVIAELMTVTVRPVPRGQRGVLTDPGTGERIINTDFLDVIER